MTNDRPTDDAAKVVQFYAYETIGMTIPHSVPVGTVDVSGCSPEQLEMLEEWIKQQEAEEAGVKPEMIENAS